MKDVAGFEYFLDLVQMIEKDDHKEPFAAKGREICDINKEIREKALKLHGDELWEASARRFLLTSPRPIRESLVENIAITVDPVTLREAVWKEALWKRMKSVEVRLCNDKGKVVQKGVTELQFRQQDWSRLRVGLWDDHKVWIDSVPTVKVAGKPGRPLAYKEAYEKLEERLQNGDWTFKEEAVHNESGARLGPTGLKQALSRALSDSDDKTKPGIIPSDPKTIVSWAKKITGFQAE